MARLETYEERYRYLRLQSSVGMATFGFERYANQRFYTSREWRNLRDEVIVRDEGCDLGIPGREIFDRIIIHHMNPVKIEDIEHGNADILDPEFLICVTHRTHNAIHYGDESLLVTLPPDRKPNDTLLWPSIKERRSRS